MLTGFCLTNTQGTQSPFSDPPPAAGPSTQASLHSAQPNQIAEGLGGTLSCAGPEWFLHRTAHFVGSSGSSIDGALHHDLLQTSEIVTSALKALQELVESEGYPFERHVYSTKDDYICSVHRISGPKGTNAM